MNKELSVLPSDTDELKQEILRLRAELTEALQELTYLQRIECPNIQMHYMLTLGVLELKLIDAKGEYLRLRRKLDLLQAKHNRQEPIRESAIEAELDAEFEEYRQTIQDLERKMKAAQSRSKQQAEALRKEEPPELKKLYRKIVKALHPDLNPDVTDAQREMLRQAMDAYERGDVEALQIIADAVDDPNCERVALEAAREALRKERDRLLSALQAVRKTIDEVKSTYPYTLKSILDSPEEIERRRKEFQSALEEYEKLIAQLRQKIAQLLRGENNG